VLLANIRGPEDLKRLTPEQLAQVAQEIRACVVETVARNGGHLGANLGAVELTLALHTVFDSPRDRIVWDVGHQAYGHKLVTGRFAAFPTIRQPGGLSGFLKRRESVHDHWEAGHGGTSLSAALGMARARDLQGGDYHVVAVIGDGSLTAGMAFEALNNIGQSGTRLIVLLNDNGMSIGRNVGALPAYFARLRTQPAYLRLRDDLHYLLERIPRIGPRMAATVSRVKDSLKYLVLPGMLFEELGFTYLGPVDGHNLAAVQQVLREARQVRGPVICHVVTVKGKGYRFTEDKPEASHAWSGPFDPKTGQVFKKPGPPTYTAVFSKTLIRLAEQDPTVVAITAAMAEGTGLAAFGERFPERCFDVGMAEQHAVTFAAGLAASGMKPVAAIYATFLQRAYDQIVHDVCHQNLHVVFALDRGGLVGADGATHQGVFDFAYLRHVPNMVVMAPKDENELQHMLRTALDHDGPVALRYPRGEGTGVALDPEPVALPVGRAEVVREGGDVAILSIGTMLPRALEAARLLEAKGVSATVVNARFVKPLDAALIIELAERIGRIVTVEEHAAAAGFGSAVLECLAAAGLSGVAVRVLGIPDQFVDHGNPARQLDEFGLSPAAIAEAALALQQPRRRRGGPRAVPPAATPWLHGERRRHGAS
jgi:1-deoxy-D-xylulose-5-phosphate synthase